MATYYETLKQARINKGIRLIDISNDTGYSVQNISNFEHGRTNNAILYNYYMMCILADEKPKDKLDTPKIVSERVGG